MPFGQPERMTTGRARGSDRTLLSKDTVRGRSGPGPYLVARALAPNEVLGLQGPLGNDRLAAVLRPVVQRNTDESRDWPDRRPARPVPDLSGVGVETVDPMPAQPFTPGSAGYEYTVGFLAAAGSDLADVAVTGLAVTGAAALAGTATLVGSMLFGASLIGALLVAFPVAVAVFAALAVLLAAAGLFDEYTKAGEELPGSSAATQGGLAVLSTLGIRQYLQGALGRRLTSDEALTARGSGAEIGHGTVRIAAALFGARAAAGRLGARLRGAGERLRSGGSRLVDSVRGAFGRGGSRPVPAEGSGLVDVHAPAMNTNATAPAAPAQPVPFRMAVGDDFPAAVEASAEPPRALPDDWADRPVDGTKKLRHRTALRAEPQVGKSNQPTPPAPRSAAPGPGPQLYDPRSGSNQIRMMTPKEMIDVLIADGWYIARQDGTTHVQLKHPTKSNVVTVPLKGYGDVIPRGIQMKMLRNAGLKG